MTSDAKDPPSTAESGADELRDRVEELERVVARQGRRLEILELALLESRGLQPAAPPQGERGAPSELSGDRYLVIRVSRRLLGLPLDCVREVIRMVTLRPIPNASSFVEGLLDLRGEPVEVVNLRVAFGDERLTNDLNCRIVLIQLDGRTYGLKTDDVLNAERIKWEEVDSPPGLTNAGYMTGVVGFAGELVILLEPRRLLEALRVEESLTLEGVEALPGQSGAGSRPGSREA